jgi:GNAT superfamily N-acetyltransferase
MITFAHGKLEDIRDEAQLLINEHYKEVGAYQDDLEIDVDWEKYIALEKLGAMVAFVARDDEILFGYAVFSLSHPMHYKTIKAATNSALFVSKPYRKGRLAIRFMKDIERRFINNGIDKITWYCKATNDFSPILKKMGYKLEDIAMTRLIRRY